MKGRSCLRIARDGFLVLLAGFFALESAPSKAQDLDDVLRLLVPGTALQGRPARSYEVPPPGAPRRAPSQLIQRAQSLLNELGYDAGPVDGALGGRTLRALNDFQRDHGLAATRRVDRRTLSALQKVARDGAAPSSPEPDLAAEPPVATHIETVAADTGQPSFDCASARQPSEKTICASPVLSGLDQQLASAYKAAVVSAGDRQAEGRLRNEQRSWILQRQRCERNFACLEALYQARIATLSGQGGEGPVGSAGDNGGEVQGGPRTRALTIVRVDGAPVISPEVSSGGATLLHLAAYAASPGLVEERRRTGGMSYAVQLALDLLPLRSPEQDSYLFGGSFKGENEFERKATQERFLADYGAKMRAMAPKPPFRLALAQAGTLSRYDEERKGFRLGEAPNYLARHYYTDFLTPRALRDEPKPEMFWPISPDDAKNELRQLAADAKYSTEARSIYKVAIVDVMKIDETTRTADVVLRGYEVYDRGFSRKLYSIASGTTPDSAPEGARSGPEAFARLLNLPSSYKRWSVGFYEGAPLFREDQADPILFSAIREKLEPGFLERNICGLADLLTDKTRAGYMGHCDSSNGPAWVGSDEFERAEAAAAFRKQDFSKAILAAAPSLPLRFAYVDDVKLGEYSAEKGGFANRWYPPQYQGGVSTQGSVHSLGSGRSDSVVGDYPDPLVKMSVSDARALTQEMADWHFQPQGDHKTLQLGGRWLRRITTYEVKAFEPKTSSFSLIVTAMALYDGPMKRKVYDFPIHGGDLPFQLGSVPAKLVSPDPVEFNRAYLSLIALDAASQEERAKFLSDFRSVILERDSGDYKGGSKTPPQFASDDARRPFYTYDSRFVRTSDDAQFEAYAMAVRAGLPDEVVVKSDVYRGNIRQGYSFGAATYLGNSLNPGDLAEALAESGLQGDQIHKQWAGQAHFILALPNSRELYSVPADLGVLAGQDERPITQTARFKVGALKRLTAKEGDAPVFLLEMEPLSIHVSLDGRQIAERRFDDVPRLNDATADNVETASAAVSPDLAEAPVAPLEDGLLLTAQSADLISLALVGNSLPKDALAYRVLRRWHDEKASDDPVGGRFFTVGRRSPTVEEARELGPKLIGFAQKRLPQPPIKIRLDGTATVASAEGVGFWPWAMMACLGGQEMQSSLNSIKWRGPSSSLKNKRHFAQTAGGSRWTPDDERQLLVSTARGKATDFVHPLAGSCRGEGLSVGLHDTVTTYLTIPVNLPAPPVEAIRPGERVHVSAILTVSSARLQDFAPDGPSLLPASFADSENWPPTTARNPGKSLVFDASLVEAIYTDDGGREVFRSSGDKLYSIAAIVSAFEQESAATSQDPMFDFPHDIVGIRLGMSFEEAEQAIRGHMKVWKVVDGRRSLDEADEGAFLRPATSGKLFVAEGAREFIAIIDEPPAVTGKVLLAWRRVYFEPGKVPENEIADSLRSKYGVPTSQPISPGIRNYWSTALGNGCQAQYQHGAPMMALGATWVENGVPFGVTMPDGAPVGDATLPQLVVRPQDPDRRAGDDCGPVFTAQYSFDASRTAAAGFPMRSLDWVELILSNAGDYAAAFNANRSARQAGDGPGSAKPMIKF
jgi:uncharacterized protein YecT (DUF1311 family)